MFRKINNKVRLHYLLKVLIAELGRCLIVINPSPPPPHLWVSPLFPTIKVTRFLVLRKRLDSEISFSVAKSKFVCRRHLLICSDTEGPQRNAATRLPRCPLYYSKHSLTSRLYLPPDCILLLAESVLFARLKSSFMLLPSKVSYICGPHQIQ